MLICKNCNSSVVGSQEACQNCGASSDSFIQTDVELPLNSESEAVAVTADAEEAVAVTAETEETVAVTAETEETVAVTAETEETVVVSADTKEVVSATNPIPAGKKSKKPLIIGLAVILIALLAVSAYGMKDLLKTPKQRYMEAESKYFTGVFTNIKAESEKAKAKMNRQYEQKMNLSVSPDLSAYNGENSLGDPATLDQLEKIIKGIEIETDTKVDGVKKAMISDFNIKLKGNVLVNGTVATDQDKFLLKLPQFYDKAVSINLKELDKVYENLGINTQTMPKRLQTQDVLDAVKIDNAALAAEGIKFSKIYFDAISDDQVKAEKSSLVFKDKKIDCRKLTVSMNKAEVIQLLENLVNEAEKDEVLKQQLFENAKNVMKLYQDAGYFNSAEYDIDNMFSDSNYAEIFSTMKKGIQDMKENTKLDYGVIMTLWVSNEGDIITREIKSDILDDGTNVNVLYSGTGYHSDTLKLLNYSLKIEDKSVEDPQLISIDINSDSENLAKNSKEGSDRLTIAGEFKSGLMDDQKVNLSVNTKRKMVDNILNGDTDFSFILGDFNMSGTVNLINIVNEKLKENSNKFNVNLEITPSSSSADVIKGNIKLDLVTKEDAVVDLSGLMNGDNVELDKLDSTQMSELSNEIQQKAMEFVQLNQNIFAEFFY